MLGGFNVTDASLVGAEYRVYDNAECSSSYLNPVGTVVDGYNSVVDRFVTGDYCIEFVTNNNVADKDVEVVKLRTSVAAILEGKIEATTEECVVRNSIISDAGAGVHIFNTCALPVIEVEKSLSGDQNSGFLLGDTVTFLVNIENQ